MKQCIWVPKIFRVFRSRPLLFFGFFGSNNIKKEFESNIANP